MKRVFNVLMATLLAMILASQTGVLAAPQMADVVESVEESEVFEEDVTAEEPQADEAVSDDESEDVAEDEAYEWEEEAEESDETEEVEDIDESEEAEESDESEESDEVAVLFTETGDVIYLARKITLSTTSMKMTYGSSKALTVAFTPEETTDKSVTWTSSKESVATVDENGVVTAYDVAGTAKITAVTANGKKATCSVTVGAPADTVELTSSITSMAVDKTITLKAKASRTDESKPVSTAVTFEIISGEEFVTIDAKGKVKGIAEGEAVVRATAEAGTEDAYEDVTIRVCVPATKVALNTTKAVMVLGGEQLQLEAVMLPEENTDKLFWSSSNEEVATVDENGLVTAHSVGSVKITAISGSGKKATCSVTVGAPADTVEYTSLKSTSLAVGKTLTLKAKASRTDKSKPVSTAVTFEIISGEEFATIDAKGKLTGVATGEVVVRARAVACVEDVYADVIINVCIPATKVVLNTTKAVMVLDGEQLQLEAVMLPEENTDTLSWSSSKEEVATVDENGLVTAHSAGSVKITATSGSGKKATCSVTVGAPADTVEYISLKSTSLAVGKTLTLKAKASRTDKSKPVSTAVTFEIISGEEFATIDAKGKLTGVATGEVVVRATAAAGTEEAYADVTINVCIPVTSVKFEQTKVTLALGETVELQMPVLSPENHTDTLKFYSDKEDIVKIDELGNLVPVSKGSAKIYAESGSGKKGYYTVTVVYPEDKLVLEASSETARVSADTVTVDIMVLNNPGISGMTFELEFDDSVLQVASVSKGGYSEFEIVPGNQENSPYRILAFNAKGDEVTGDGLLASVTFNILDGAQKGKYEIAVKSSNEERNLLIIDESGEIIEHLVVDGNVTLR